MLASKMRVTKTMIEPFDDNQVKEFRIKFA